MHKSTPHSDARGTGVQTRRPDGARAGGRERWTSRQSQGNTVAASMPHTSARGRC